LVTEKRIEKKEKGRKFANESRIFQNRWAEDYLFALTELLFVSFVTRISLFYKTPLLGDTMKQSLHHN
jgi:hypothetical protein